MVHSCYLVATKGWREADLGCLAILPFMLLRMLHHQAWITVSRLQNARGKNQIVDRGIEFDQVDRERNWYACIPFLFLLIENVVMHQGSIPNHLTFKLCQKP